mmetsp:Transcript_40351/g.75419  ORF Transcript_40351/g.75419 Transcript_40351/m.75419 type:complete len:219 (+) Transcript_40351:1809-2465(+)
MVRTGAAASMAIWNSAMETCPLWLISSSSKMASRSSIVATKPSFESTRRHSFLVISRLAGTSAEKASKPCFTVKYFSNSCLRNSSMIAWPTAWTIAAFDSVPAKAAFCEFTVPPKGPLVETFRSGADIECTSWIPGCDLNSVALNRLTIGFFNILFLASRRFWILWLVGLPVSTDSSASRPALDVGVLGKISSSTKAVRFSSGRVSTRLLLWSCSRFL